jgi:hypothetical protein
MACSAVAVGQVRRIRQYAGNRANDTVGGDLRSDFGIEGDVDRGDLPELRAHLTPRLSDYAESLPPLLLVNPAMTSSLGDRAEGLIAGPSTDRNQ